MRAAALGVVALALAAGPAHGQASGELETFVQAVEAAGRRFTDVDSAIAKGYRKLGPDFPGMGEHWIHPGRVIGGELDPERPPVLAYTMVAGRRRLVGFAFTRVLGPDESPPAGPFPTTAWHDHTGGVDEESLLLSGPVSAHAGGERFRLSMVHVWIPLENADGLLAQNNWALPFLRLGIPAPTHVSTEAARALSLSTETGDAFYQELLSDGLGLRDTELQVASERFSAASRASTRWLAGVEQGAPVSSEQLARLEGIWEDLWQGLADAVSSESFDAMTILRAP